MEKSLLDIKRLGVADVVGPLRAGDRSQSAASGQTLLGQAKDYGIPLAQYLELAIKPEGELSGFELALQHLNLPIRNDFKNGVVLQAASETFQTHPGTRALFPEVIDQMLRWNYRQDLLEQVAPMLSNSRTINGVEVLSTVVDDAAADYQTNTVPELGRIPVKTIRTSEKTVKIFKHGSGYRFSYEFNRRASLDLITPYANRVVRELELSKVAVATNVLVNGDGAYGAANVVSQSAYNAAVGTASVNGVISWEHLLYWLVQRAKAGLPVDTIVGNWDSAFKWAQLWKIDSNGTNSNADRFTQVSTKLAGGTLKVPMPNFVVSSAAPATKLIGYTRGETLEELVEANSMIQESERAILNQSITFIKTETTGYKLAFGDTREILNYGA